MNILKIIFEKIVSISFSKWQIKVMLALSAFVIVISVVLYTQILVNDLIQREQRLINYYANMYDHYSDFENIDDLWFFTNNIGPTISFPVIMTNENDEPNYPFEDYSLNIELDTSMSLQEQREYLQDYVEEMGSSYQPIKLSYDIGGEILVVKFYYTNSSLVKALNYFPLISIFIIAAFVFVGYMAFSNIRRNEESKVWVGMAKEAAHQLGTPLSSLLAWVEILKLNRDDPDSIHDTILEMGNDINRLNKITTRFSKIGSMPEKIVVDLSELIEKVCSYFEKRLPHLGKKVEIKRNLDVQVYSEVNEDLFEWVIENLLKNAAEAIESRRGEVEIKLESMQNRKIVITVSDTGKGMTNKQRRQIFNPGFTTKKRGWGLGLSLVRRIIEQYHDGKIILKDTSVGKGTSFQIELNSIKNIH